MGRATAREEPWLEALRADQPDLAWDRFIGQYKALIFATIRHYAREYDDVMDAFANVCEALRQDRLARLERYWERPTHTARFSSWLVTVVRHQVIDWARQHVFVRKSHFKHALPPLQQQIFDLVFLQQRSHVEAFELIRARTQPTLSFRAFGRELRATFLAVDATSRIALAREMAGPVPLSLSEQLVDERAESPDPAVTLDTRLCIASALRSLPPDERLAVELFVVHEMPAAAVARALRWPNAKAVYNHVYRALAALRANLTSKGIRRDDL